MKKQIYLNTIIFLGLLIICTVITVVYDSEVFYALAVTFGTFFYHFSMRLIVGGVINAIKHNQFDYSRPWFQKRAFEDSFYKKIRIKSWKTKMPTFDTEVFDIKKHSMKEIVMATCQAEVVHEIIVVLSFVPILFSVKFGAIWVFIITSIAAACFDMIFVLLQRFNRPRLIKMMEKNHKNVFDKC